MLDPDAKSSFYKHNTTEFNVSAQTSDGDTEAYRIVVVCKMDGAKNRNSTTCLKWTKGNNESQTFCDRLNENFDAVSDGKYPVSMKYIKHANNVKTNRWIVCYRKDDAEKIEIWAADAEGTWGCEPKYRVFPDPCSEYS